MKHPLFRGAERRIFQSQLAALLAKGTAFTAAVNAIAERADAPLRELVLAARQGADSREALLGGLIREQLLGPDLATALSFGAGEIDPELALRDLVKREAEAGLVLQQVRRHLGRVFWFFLLMMFFVFVIYSRYVAVVIPMLRESSGMAETPVSVRSHFFAGIATLALLAYLSFVGLIWIALKVDCPQQWRRFRFLFVIPGPAGFFRKLATWRLLGRARFLIAAGVGEATALEASLALYGLKPVSDSGAALLPETKLLDSPTLRGVNLGARLETFRAQLNEAVAELEAELPFAAQSAARALFYLGYVAYGALVFSLLMFMYDPIFYTFNISN
jgi:type II secretory pathway component PulF